MYRIASGIYFLKEGQSKVWWEKMPLKHRDRSLARGLPALPDFPTVFQKEERCRDNERTHFPFIFSSQRRHWKDISLDFTVFAQIFQCKYPYTHSRGQFGNMGIKALKVGIPFAASKMALMVCVACINPLCSSLPPGSVGMSLH